MFFFDIISFFILLTTFIGTIYNDDGTIERQEVWKRSDGRDRETTRVSIRRASHPSRPDKAAKQGYVVYRISVRRGRRVSQRKYQLGNSAQTTRHIVWA
jgi:ribosomal protein L15E